MKNKILKIVLLDLLFLFLYGFVRSGIFRRVGEYLLAIQLDLSNAAPTVNSIAGLSGNLMQNELISLFSQRIILLVILFYIMVYIIYVFIEGSAWFLVQKNKAFSKYIKRFTIVSIPLFVVFIINNILRFIQGFDPSINLLIWNIVVFIILYFYLISYSNIYKKNLFIWTIKDGFKAKKHLFLISFLILVYLSDFITWIYLYIPVGILIVGLFAVLRIKGSYSVSHLQ